MMPQTKPTNSDSNKVFDKVDSTKLESPFQDLVASANYAFVSSFHCIPFTRIREVSKYFVSKLIHFYENPESEKS